MPGDICHLPQGGIVFGKRFGGKVQRFEPLRPVIELVQPLMQYLGCAAERICTEQQAWFEWFELVVATLGCRINASGKKPPESLA
jgi:hypothetical protein